MKIKNYFGFTLYELLAVLAILAIILIITLPRVFATIDTARIRADLEDVNALNRVTSYYSISEDQDLSIFNKESNDEDKMNLLVKKGYLTETLRPRKRSESFIWDADFNIWYYTYYNIATRSNSYFDFTSLLNEDLDSSFIEVAESGNDLRWAVKEEGLVVEPYPTSNTHRHLLFMPISSETNILDEYIIIVKARLAKNSGGYGIFFETTLNNENQDVGYILQFDVGYDPPSVIIRRRARNNQGNLNESTVYDRETLPITNTKYQEIIPLDRNDDFWTNEQVLKLEVSRVSQEQKSLDVYIKTNNKFEIIIKDFIIDNIVDNPLGNFTGFRSWRVHTYFKSIEIK